MAPLLLCLCFINASNTWHYMREFSELESEKVRDECVCICMKFVLIFFKLSSALSYFSVSLWNIHLKTEQYKSYNVYRKGKTKQNNNKSKHIAHWELKLFLGSKKDSETKEPLGLYVEDCTICCFLCSAKHTAKNNSLQFLLFHHITRTMDIVISNLSGVVCFLI